jgi:four helix bundle protein
MSENQRIVSFRDLAVYRETYSSMLQVMREVVPRLPSSEQSDLKDQLSRACKAIPRLIAEGYAKRHQKAGFRKYIDDAMAECNEMVVSLSQANDIYSECMADSPCGNLVDAYDKAGRQLYRLGEAWTKFAQKAPKA